MFESEEKVGLSPVLKLAGSEHRPFRDIVGRLLLQMLNCLLCSISWISLSGFIMQEDQKAHRPFDERQQGESAIAEVAVNACQVTDLFEAGLSSIWAGAQLH